MKKKLTTFNVHLYAPIYASACIEVQAFDVEEAKQKALELATEDDSNVEWYYNDAYVDSGDIDEDKIEVGDVEN